MRDGDEKPFIARRFQVPTVQELEQAFHVYFGEIERCRTSDCHWALLHVLVSLPDICAALESENGWATEMKYVDWCRRYCSSGIVTPEDYRDIRNLVLHQGRTRTTAGRYYKFTKPTEGGNRAHRVVYDSDVVVLDVSELAKEMVGSIRTWFADLQNQPAQGRKANVEKHLPSLVMVKHQELPGITGITFNATHTSTGP